MASCLEFAVAQASITNPYLARACLDRGLLTKPYTCNYYSGENDAALGDNNKQGLWPFRIPLA